MPCQYLWQLFASTHLQIIVSWPIGCCCCMMLTPVCIRAMRTAAGETAAGADATGSKGCIAFVAPCACFALSKMRLLQQ